MDFNNHDIDNEQIISRSENEIVLEFVIPATSDFCTVRIYNRALTAEEIAHNYSIDKERFSL